MKIKCAALEKYSDVATNTLHPLKNAGNEFGCNAIDTDIVTSRL